MTPFFGDDAIAAHRTDPDNTREMPILRVGVAASGDQVPPLYAWDAGDHACGVTTNRDRADRELFLAMHARPDSESGMIRRAYLCPNITYIYRDQPLLRVRRDPDNGALIYSR